MTERSSDYYQRLVDEDALESFFTREIGPVETFDVARHEQGHSNETLFVTWGDRELVVRRPPPGQTAETAHDVLREYRVIDALQDTAVPVPPTVTACDDHEVIGSDFYVMARVEGTVIRDEEPERFTNDDAREAVGTELVDTLAAIHEVDPESVGLSDLGRARGYAKRQVTRWGKQLAWAFERTAESRTIPELERVGSWLQDECPDDHPETLVHGDYKLDNVMFGPGADPELAAVFDWEMATLGDPRADLGWLLSYWRDAKDPKPEIPDLAMEFIEAPGYLTRQDLVDRWEAQTGLTFEHERFYRTLAVYKLAALGEMFYRRYLEGNADDPFYPLMENRVPALADRAIRIIEGDEPL
ncbi:phosphotransferase family protein [Haloarcula sp. K1]|uniref:phosphotransferase family protein n=1 Tax=Haloarcula sp. K1 TaxID=1622207 RepID=UPI0007BC4514|nr:phosphotransferase family protein [Haloarcula sp. K1]KZX47395.1 aminoglycoside phosphotransferase [Haloarcula sp. K1]